MRMAYRSFLDLGIASLRIGQDLANEVHETLHFEGVSLFFSLYHQGGADYLRDGHNVEQKWFPIGWGGPGSGPSSGAA